MRQHARSRSSSEVVKVERLDRSYNSGPYLQLVAFNREVNVDRFYCGNNGVHESVVASVSPS